MQVGDTKMKTTWVNTFHKTTAISNLSANDVRYVEQSICAGYTRSNDKQYRSLMRLYKNLCPHEMTGCSCRTAMQVKDQ